MFYTTRTSFWCLCHSELLLAGHQCCSCSCLQVSVCLCVLLKCSLFLSSPGDERLHFGMCRSCHLSCSLKGVGTGWGVRMTSAHALLNTALQYNISALCTWCVQYACVIIGQTLLYRMIFNWTPVLLSCCQSHWMRKKTDSDSNFTFPCLQT